VLKGKAPVKPFSAPNHAPLWWSFMLWWDGTVASDMKYYRTADKWPTLHAYSRELDVYYWTMEYE
jgi:hypothetical protein